MEPPKVRDIFLPGNALGDSETRTKRLWLSKESLGSAKAQRPNGVRTSKVSDNLDGVQRDGNNLKIIVVHPLYIDLASRPCFRLSWRLPSRAEETPKVELYHWSRGLLS
jgi:hypothetical protein